MLFLFAFPSPSTNSLTSRSAVIARRERTLAARTADERQTALGVIDQSHLASALNAARWRAGAPQSVPWAQDNSRPALAAICFVYYLQLKLDISKGIVTLVSDFPRVLHSLNVTSKVTKETRQIIA
ncbi:hypothetical protein EVAR_24848_1 [Eumeta japonica]|uniref:Uncharacterized protein n=1 Tax=Eumeta variegata TaxID=151549 RepID=A0A4C1YB76_EUMVA|nr:hypothetical protein EVAR_24848_1 [Eumeta japonica]